MLPMLQKEVVEKYHWATEEELMDYYAIGQCTPGVIAVNTATFVGQKRRGVAGGDDAQAAALRDGRRQFPVGDPGHAALKDGVLDAQQVA